MMLYACSHCIIDENENTVKQITLYGFQTYMDSALMVCSVSFKKDFINSTSTHPFKEYDKNTQPIVFILTPSHHLSILHMLQLRINTLTKSIKAMNTLPKYALNKYQQFEEFCFLQNACVAICLEINFF